MRMHLRLTLIAGGLLIAGGTAEARWRHVKLQSAQGCKIQIDYQVNQSGGGSYKPSYSHTAGPCFVNVTGPGLTKDSKVRVVLMNYQHAGFPLPRRGGVPQSYTLDLKPSISEQYGFHFSGDLKDARVRQSYLDLGDGRRTPLLTGVTGYGGTKIMEQDVSVVVNGVWQQDPVNRTNNFQTQLGLK